jgi:ribosome recycling factor
MAYPIIETSSKKMDKAVDNFKSGLAEIRTGAANAGMLSKVNVEYYGSPTPLNQIAGISVQEGRTLVIKPYDPSSLKDIERALNEADLGIAPQNDGEVIRMTVPQMTGETRNEMVKKVGKLQEEAKIAIRNIRRDAMNTVKKDKTLDEDVQKDCENEVQKLTDKYTKTIEDLAKAKEKEVLNK